MRRKRDGDLGTERERSNRQTLGGGGEGEQARTRMMREPDGRIRKIAVP